MQSLFNKNINNPHFNFQIDKINPHFVFNLKNNNYHCGKIDRCFTEISYKN